MKTQYRCIDDTCRMVYLVQKERDGLFCLECNGPIINEPYNPTDKHVLYDIKNKRKLNVTYQCLSCNHTENLNVNKEEYKEVLVCSCCNTGAFVDIWRISKHKIKKTNFKVNFNEIVKVKLTNYGIDILKKRHEELNNLLISKGLKGLLDFSVITDEDGYTSFQIWQLMSKFGEHMSLGKKAPFEGDIIIRNGKPC